MKPFTLLESQNEKCFEVFYLQGKRFFSTFKENIYKKEFIMNFKSFYHKIELAFHGLAFIAISMITYNLYMKGRFMWREAGMPPTNLDDAILLIHSPNLLPILIDWTKGGLFLLITSVLVYSLIEGGLWIIRKIAYS